MDLRYLRYDPRVMKNNILLSVSFSTLTEVAFPEQNFTLECFFEALDLKFSQSRVGNHHCPGYNNSENV